jgi:hypothetical protein
MDSKTMQEPVANERANNANRGISNETKPIAPDDLSGQPSGNDPNDQTDKQPFVRQMHSVSFSPRSDAVPTATRARTVTT